MLDAARTEEVMRGTSEQQIESLIGTGLARTGHSLRAPAFWEGASLAGTVGISPAFRWFGPGILSYKRRSGSLLQPSGVLVSRGVML